MCIPIYVVTLIQKFDLQWLKGWPFILTYYGFLIGYLVIPILIFLQAWYFFFEWYKRGIFNPKGLWFIALSSGLYFTPLLFGRALMGIV